MTVGQLYSNKIYIGVVLNITHEHIFGLENMQV